MVVSPLQADFGSEIRIRFVLAPDALCEARGRVLRSIKVGEECGLAFEFSKTNEAFANFLRNLDSSSAHERQRFLSDVETLSIEIVT
jgi:hypothetical protein